MKASKFVLTVVFGCAASIAQAAPSGPLYIDDANGRIGTVDLATGNVVVLGNAGVTLTDIAFTSDGKLYGTSFTGFYSLNSSTGAATLVSDYAGVGGGSMNALVGAGTRLFAASGATSSLYSITVSPYSITTLSGTTGGSASGDIAPTPGGSVFYETLSNGDLARLTVSGNTLTSTIVGNTGLSNVYGLATGDDGVTYAVSGTTIYSVNLNTAALTRVFDYGGKGLDAANGTAFFREASVTPTAVPEPASLALLGLGLLGITAMRRKQRSV